LKERRERIEEGGSVEKKKVQGVFGQTAIPFLSIRTEEGEGINRAAGWQGCSLVVQCTATPGRWGKTERRPRGSQPRAHLVLWSLVEAAPRAAASGGGGERRWCDVGCGRERETAGGAGWGEERHGVLL
jgi:hypothetical protein